MDYWIDGTGETPYESSLLDGGEFGISMNLADTQQTLLYRLVRVGVALCCLCVIMAISFGCARKTKTLTDPIDRFVRDSSSNPYFGNGYWGIVNLTNTASPIEVAAKALNQPVANLRILEVKRVTIGFGNKTNGIPEEAGTYTAVLFDEGKGYRILLMDYWSDKQSGGWSYRFYNVK